MILEWLILLLILVPVAGVVLGAVAFVQVRGLRRELARLSDRIRVLEAGGVGASVPVGAGVDQPSSAANPIPVEEPVVAPDADAAAEPPVPDTEPLAPPRLPPPIPAAARRPDVEEALGSRWAVWIGGLALALGGVFMVRYSIEAGLLGPGLRILLALALAAALLAAGEWLRRSGFAETGDARLPYVPGIVTAAGTVTAFAAVYAAYVLYGFLGDTAAFLALAAIALATLALALVHGPGLAGMGLAASYAAPLLVSSDKPAFGALSLYLLVVTVATLGVARLKVWRWLAVTAVVGAALWSILMSAGSVFSGYDGPVIGLYTALVLALAHATFVLSIHPVDPGLPAPHDRTATAVLTGLSVPVLFHVAVFGTGAVGFALVLVYAAGLVATVYGVAAIRGTVIPAAVVLLLAYSSVGVPVGLVLDPVGGGLVVPDLATLLASPEGSRLVGTGLVLGLLFAGLGLFGALGSVSRPHLAAIGGAVPLGLLVVAYLLIARFEVSVAFGFVGLLLAGYCAVAAETVARRLGPGVLGGDGAVAAYAVAAIAALVAALAMTFERGVLTLALAAVVPGIALVEAARPVKGLRPVAVIAALLVSARFVWDPAVVGSDLGTTPVFNWLLIGYGGPALGFAYAAWRFQLTRPDPFVPVFEALAVAFTTLTAIVLIHHGMTGGDLGAPVSGLAEQGLHAATLFAVALGLQWLAVRRPSPVFGKGTLVLGALGMLTAAIGLLVTENPLMTGEPIDGGFFDGSLLAGYLLPAALAFAVSAVAARRPDRPDWYVVGSAALGGVLGAVWITYAVRAVWHGEDFGWGAIEEGELYTYSAVWLLIGIAVLLGGALARVRTIRLVATAILAVVVLKVFLVDTAELSGLLRSASLVGLGLVLIPLGLAYQTLMRRLA